MLGSHEITYIEYLNVSNSVDEVFMCLVLIERKKGMYAVHILLKIGKKDIGEQQKKIECGKNQENDGNGWLWETVYKQQ